MNANEEPCGKPQGINSHITNTATATLWQATGNSQVKYIANVLPDGHLSLPEEIKEKMGLAANSSCFRKRSIHVNLRPKKVEVILYLQ